MDEIGVVGGAAQGAAAGTSIVPGWGTAIGAVVGGASSLFGQRAAEKARAKQIAKILRLHDQMRASQVAQNARTQESIRSAGAAMEAGFNRSRNLLGGAGRAAEIRTADQSLQALAKIQRDLNARRSSASSMIAMARMGLAGQASRVYSEIGSRVAQSIAAIEQDRAQSQAQTQLQLAQAGQSGQQALNQIDQSRMEVMGADVPVANDTSRQIGVLFGALDAIFGGMNKKKGDTSTVDPTSPTGISEPPVGGADAPPSAISSVVSQPEGGGNFQGGSDTPPSDPTPLFSGPSGDAPPSNPISIPGPSRGWSESDWFGSGPTNAYASRRWIGAKIDNLNMGQ